MRVLSRKIIIFFNETNLILFIELRKESYDYYKAILNKGFHDYEVIFALHCSIGHC